MSSLCPHSFWAAGALAFSLWSCGEPPAAAQLAPFGQTTVAQAIVDGTQSAAADYPATGAIVYRSAQLGHAATNAMLCSATLIAPDVVIAAGHCDAALLGATKEAVHFFFTLSLDVTEAGLAAGALPKDAVRITRFVPHPDFSLDNLGYGLRPAKDIALLVLERSIDYVKPARLIRREQADALVRGAEVYIVGYGKSRALASGPTDMGVKYQGVSYIDEVAPYEMQVGRAHPGSYKCNGDSGGPTYMHLPQQSCDVGEAELTLVGITSRIYTYGNCDTGGTDTRIDPYLPWIQRTLQDTCRSGVRPSCRTRYDLRWAY